MRLASMGESFRILRPWIRHVHIHDGTTNTGVLEFKASGEGEYDLDTVFRSLLADEYKGYISGEWINWEPAREHLPGKIKRMRTFETDLCKTAT
jgi:sugar phosphate isomerase/epimerase